MSVSAYQLVLWAHLLCMLSIVGALLVIRRGLPYGSRHDAVQVRPILGLASGLLAGGLVAGLTVYMMMIRAVRAAGGELPSRTHMLVGIKILLLLVIGACLGASAAMLKKGKPGPAGALQWVAIAALAGAALIGLLV